MKVRAPGRFVALAWFSCLAVLAAGLSSVVASNLDRRPLRAADDDRPIAGQPEEGDDQLFYYSDGKKVFLSETGLAVAKVREGQNPNEAPAESGLEPVSLAPGDPLRDLAPALGSAGLVIVNAEEPRALDVNAAPGRADDIEYILPIVEIDRVRAPEALSNPGDARPSPMIMTPGIAARFKPGVDVEARIKPLGLKIVQKQGRVPNGYVLGLERGAITYTRLIQAANRLYEQGRESGEVLYAHPDFIPTRQRQQPTPNGRASNQWHLENRGAAQGTVDADIDAEAAWRITRGRPEIRIAIIDDSVQRDHPDLAPNYQAGIYYNGATFPPSSTDDPSPKSGQQRHGTACAGVAVGAGIDSGQPDDPRPRGSAPGCGLIGVNFWDATVAQTADAFYFCNDPDGDPSTDDGAAVISCSWSWNFAFDSVRTAVEEVARDGWGGRGIVVLFAAANDYSEIAVQQRFGTIEEVICVGATNWRDDHSPYSNHGPELDVVAPSNDIDTPGALSIETSDNTDNMPRQPGRTFSGYASGDYTGNGLTGFGGTSSATPLTAGVCGLIRSINDQLTAVEVRAILEHTSDRVRGGLRVADYDPATSLDPYYGYGRINARRAVHVARSALDDPEVIWPDHVSALTATQSGNAVRLQWRNPSAELGGVLVVRGAAPIGWKPRDGERYRPGDLLPGDLRVVSVEVAEGIDDPGVNGAPHFAVFAFNKDHRYSWGQVVRWSP